MTSMTEVPPEMLLQMIGEREVEKRYFRDVLAARDQQIDVLNRQIDELGKQLSQDMGEPT